MDKHKKAMDDKEEKAEGETTPEQNKRAECGKPHSEKAMDDKEEKAMDDKEDTAEVVTTPVESKRAMDDEHTAMDDDGMKAEMASMGGRFTVLSTSENVKAKRAEQDSKIAEMFTFNDKGGHNPER